MKEILNMHEIVVYLDSDYYRNDSFTVEKGASKKEINKICDERYGEKGWYSYDIF